MSPTSGSSHTVNRNLVESKISFKGLEKCLEAFTSGEGRVVRKYARLLSQLSSRDQDDEDDVISWSSSDDDRAGAPSQNTGIRRRSKFTRKLSSHIDFENSIRSKQHGRRLTRAQFSRTLGRFSQDPLGNQSPEKFGEKSRLSTQEQTLEESRLSVLNTSFLEETVQTTFRDAQEKEEIPLTLTPRSEDPANDLNIVSPVFKLQRTRTARKKYKVCSSRNAANKNRTESREDQLPPPQVISCSDDRNTNENRSPSAPLILEMKTIGGNEVLESNLQSPLSESRSPHHLPMTEKTSPILCEGNPTSVSPIVRKTVRKRCLRQATAQHPVSPVLERQRKYVAFKRKRKTGHKSSSQIRLAETSSDLNISSSPVISKRSLRPCKIKSSTVLDPSKQSVKRSLDFNSNNNKNGGFPEAAREMSDIAPDNECSKETEKTFASVENTVIENSQNFSASPISTAVTHNYGTKSKNSMKIANENPRVLNPVSLNETNMIEEVFTEELELPKELEPVVRHKRKKLSLQTKHSGGLSEKKVSKEDAYPCRKIEEEKFHAHHFAVPLAPINRNTNRRHINSDNTNVPVSAQDFQTNDISFSNGTAGTRRKNENVIETKKNLEKLAVSYEKIIEENSQMPFSPVPLKTTDKKAKTDHSDPDNRNRTVFIDDEDSQTQDICQPGKTTDKDETDISPRQETIEENSQTQVFAIPHASKRKHCVLGNLNKIVFIDENSQMQDPCHSKKTDPKDQTYRSLVKIRDFSREKLHGTLLIDEDSETQGFVNPGSQRNDVSVNENKDEQEKNYTCQGEKRIEYEESIPAQVAKSVMQASREIGEEFRTSLTAKRIFGKSLHLPKDRSIAPEATDQELRISQSSTKSDGLRSRVCSPEIESVSSQTSHGNKESDNPSNEAISKTSSNKSPVISSPLIISSAGSTSDVCRENNSPFVIIEDEYNAPPKRRSKKLDPNGLAARLQRLINQRRSSARIWQFKRSKLNRLNSSNAVGQSEETSKGRVLTVCSVWIESSHVILSTKENQGGLTNGREFRSSVLVVLDPGVIMRLGKIMSASSIEIFPPWQAMDIVGRNVTVILGANIVEVLSTNPLPSLTHESEKESVMSQKYTCQCIPSASDSVVLDCWDGVQSIGLLDILFPPALPSCSQLVQCNETTMQRLSGFDPKTVMCKQKKYSVKEMLSTNSTVSHGKGQLVLTVLRVLCFWQRSGDESNMKDASPHWSIIGKDYLEEVCEVLLGPVSFSQAEDRFELSDFITGKALGRTYKLRGLAVSQRLDRSRYCGVWSIFSEEQKILYVLVPSNQFSLSLENSALDRKLWEPEITTLAESVHTINSEKQCGFNRSTRVSVVCRIFHVNERHLYIGDQSTLPQLRTVILRPTAVVPPDISAAVRKPKSTKLLVLLQDVETSKGTLIADKLSRLLVLNDKGHAYKEEVCSQKNWPVGQEVCKTLLDAKAMLPLFSEESCVHSLVLLTGSVCGVDESSALIWPACGTCGSTVNTSETESPNHFCAQCSSVSEQLVLQMSLVVLVTCKGFSGNCTIRVKLLQNTIQALLRAMPKEGQDYTVREALGKAIGPIRCEVTSAHNGNFVLRELPSSLWKYPPVLH